MHVWQDLNIVCSKKTQANSKSKCFIKNNKKKTFVHNEQLHYSYPFIFNKTSLSWIAGNVPDFFFICVRMLLLVLGNKAKYFTQYYWKTKSYMLYKRRN